MFHGIPAPREWKSSKYVSCHVCMIYRQPHFPILGCTVFGSRPLRQANLRNGLLNTVDTIVLLERVHDWLVELAVHWCCKY